MNRHGSVKLTWDKDLLIIDIHGPFNEDGMAYCISKIKEEVKSTALQRWKRLELWDNESLGSPEVLAQTKLLYDWYFNQGCVLSAVVISNLLQEHIVRDIFHSDIIIFSVLADAKAWISSQDTN